MAGDFDDRTSDAHGRRAPSTSTASEAKKRRANVFAGADVAFRQPSGLITIVEVY